MRVQHAIVRIVLVCESDFEFLWVSIAAEGSRV
jgi:hypothetical protein